MENIVAPVNEAGGKPYTAPRRQIWGWAAGRVAEFGLIGTYGQAMTIFSVGFGLNPVIVGWCMMLPRLVDGVLDPIIGHWSDNLHTRWGRRKPFLVGGAFLGAIFLALLWWADPGWSPTAQFLHLGIVGTCLYLCYGAYAMAWTATGYELSDDYHERSRVAAIGGIFLAAMTLSNGWIYWFALRPMFGSVIWGMRWVGAAMALLVIGFAVITTLTTRERFAHTNRKHTPILPALRTTLGNRPFIYLLLLKVFEIFGGRLVGGVSFYLGVYYTCRGDQELATRLAGIGATLGTVWNFAMLPLVKPASRLVGKRGTLIVCTAIGLLTALASPFLTTPEHPYWSLIPALIVAPLLVMTSIVSTAILPDICDVDELQTGERREGLFTAVMGFVGKLEISLAVVLVGYVVSLASVDTNIGHRWEKAVAGTEEAGMGFPSGEAAVYQFKDEQPTTFDTFSVVVPAGAANSVREFELYAGDEAPTSGFRLVGRFDAPAADKARRQEFHFSPTTAKYFKVIILSGHDPAAPVSLRGLRLTNSKAIGQEAPVIVGNSPEAPVSNLLAAEQGGKMLAAIPPQRVVNKLYWLVMIPGIVFAALTFLMTVGFPLTEARMAQVRAALDRRRIERAAAGEPTDTVAEALVHEHPEVAGEALYKDDPDRRPPRGLP